MRTTDEPKTKFQIVLESKPGMTQEEAEQALKAVLKRAGRNYGLTCKAAKVLGEVVVVDPFGQ